MKITKKTATIFKYIKGVFRILRRNGPFTLIKKASGSDVVIKNLEEYGFSVFLRCDDYAVARPLLFTDHYEENVAKTLQRYLRIDSVFIDIGANIGFFSLLAARIAPKGKVLSFEPDRNNFKLLSTAILYNGLENIISAYPVAVSDQDDTIVLSDLGSSKNTGARFTAKDISTLRPLVHGPDPFFERVKAVSLDNFISDQNVDLIKIDIEGYEPFAFRGMEQILNRYKPVVIVEFAPGNLMDVGNVKPETFLDYLRELGFRMYLIEQNGRVIPVNTREQNLVSECRRRQRHHLDLLLLPEGRQ